MTSRVKAVGERARACGARERTAGVRLGEGRFQKGRRALHAGPLTPSTPPFLAGEPLHDQGWPERTGQGGGFAPQLCIPRCGMALKAPPLTGAGGAVDGLGRD